VVSSLLFECISGTAKIMNWCYFTNCSTSEFSHLVSVLLSCDSDCTLYVSVFVYCVHVQSAVCVYVCGYEC